MKNFWLFAVLFIFTLPSLTFGADSMKIKANPDGSFDITPLHLTPTVVSTPTHKVDKGKPSAKGKKGLQRSHVTPSPTPTPDRIPPVITLLGPNPATVVFGTKMVYDPNVDAMATDNLDGNLTQMIWERDHVNTSVAGTYVMEYSVSDRAGNTATATRTVIVMKKNGLHPFSILWGMRTFEISPYASQRGFQTDPGSTVLNQVTWRTFFEKSKSICFDASLLFGKVNLSSEFNGSDLGKAPVGFSPMFGGKGFVSIGKGFVVHGGVDIVRIKAYGAPSIGGAAQPTWVEKPWPIMVNIGIDYQVSKRLSLSVERAYVVDGATIDTKFIGVGTEQSQLKSSWFLGASFNL